jgi:hypothetical protein
VVWSTLAPASRRDIVNVIIGLSVMDIHERRTAPVGPAPCESACSN